MTSSINVGGITDPRGKGGMSKLPQGGIVLAVEQYLHKVVRRTLQ